MQIRTFVGNTIVNFTPGQKLMKKDVITCFVSSEGIMPPSTCIGAEEKVCVFQLTSITSDNSYYLQYNCVVSGTAKVLCLCYLQKVVSK